MMIPAIFYVVVAAAGLDIPTLRHDGWIFDMGGSSESWYKFYSYFSTFIHIFQAYENQLTNGQQRFQPDKLPCALGHNADTICTVHIEYLAYLEQLIHNFYFI